MIVNNSVEISGEKNTGCSVLPYLYKFITYTVYTNRREQGNLFRIYSTAASRFFGMRRFFVTTVFGIIKRETHLNHLMLRFNKYTSTTVPVYLRILKN